MKKKIPEPKLPKLKLSLTLQNPADHKPAPTKQQFSSWIKAALLPPLTTAEITVRIAGCQESAQLNEQYRHKTGPTNVLSFSYSQQFPQEIAGDIVICADLVAQEAQAEGKMVIAHWAHLTVHGILHLQGYDHIEIDDATKMEQLETRILQSLGFPDPYHGFEKDDTT